MNKSDREAMQVLKEKHQKKHPGCSLSERRCRKELSDDCVGMGDKSEFLNGGARCIPCVAVQQKEYYNAVTLEKRRAASEILRRKKNRKVVYRKGTKKE